MVCFTQLESSVISALLSVVIRMKENNPVNFFILPRTISVQAIVRVRFVVCF